MKTAAQTRAREMAQVMIGFAESKPVEKRWRPENVWVACPNPDWDWYSCEFRLAPAPTVKPWTFETFPAGLRKVRRKVDGALHSIALYPDGVTVWPSLSDSMDLTYLELRDDYEQLDGSPCGEVVPG